MGKQDKLYKQWAEHSGLPPEAIPKKEPTHAIPRVAKEKPVRERPVRERPAPGEGGGSRQRLNMLYIMLIVAVIIVCVGMVILYMHAS
jgi:hypothetical protein